MKKWNRSNIGLQDEKLVVVTGTGGIGYEAALALAAAEAEVIIAGRNKIKGEEAVEKIRKTVPHAKIRLEILDLASLDSIRQFGRRMRAIGRPVDILINNAAVMAIPKRQETVDGFELQFGTNHLGHFLLTYELLPLLRQASHPVVTTVSSIAHRGTAIDLNNLQSEKSYSPWDAYKASKMANMLFAQELQRRSDKYGWNITSNAAHPGFARTDLIANGPGNDSLFSKFSDLVLKPITSHSAAAGALPILFASVSPQAVGGTYWGPDGFYEMKGAPAPAHIDNRALGEMSALRLWEESERLVGARFRGDVGRLTATAAIA